MMMMTTTIFINTTMTLIAKDSKKDSVVRDPPDKVSVQAVGHRSPYGSRQTEKQLLRFDALGSLPQILVVGNDALSQTDVETFVYHVSLGVRQFVAEARSGGVRVRQTGRYCGHQVGEDELAQEYDHRKHCHLT